ncbi:hypothetical protein Lpp126_11970 [Lacticaseibacillus paracasei subsp. paracasei Lpp126]|uniref:Uncharacterized protein n=1 Tax=Lacticaseibacillus paracasei subsp. paracasei Lpp126 TaxID=1256206 RepID=S2R7E4_LACPA|nr:hypothetical protein Lpp126_11970 [Lacticaseibacillus paracasei subsp. paracasei Lpp126]
MFQRRQQQKILKSSKKFLMILAEKAPSRFFIWIKKRSHCFEFGFHFISKKKTAQLCYKTQLNGLALA